MPCDACYLLLVKPDRARRVSTTLRQVLTEFSEFFMCWVFYKEISRQDRLATTIANSVDPQHPRFCPSSGAFRFSKVDRSDFICPPTGSGSGVATGLLIQTSLGRAGGWGALRTKRSG